MSRSRIAIGLEVRYEYVEKLNAGSHKGKSVQGPGLITEEAHYVNFMLVFKQHGQMGNRAQ